MAQTQLKIFFDLDGTLIDVSVRHYKVYYKSVIAHDGTPMPQAAYWDLKRQKIGWQEILLKSGLSPDLEPDFLDSFISKIESTEYLKIDTLFVDAISTLQIISTQHDCYLVSLRRRHQNLMNELSWLGIDKYFKKILTGHSETDGYAKKIELISTVIAKDEIALIVGDTEADIITGKKLGFKTVAVLSGIRNREILALLNPDFIIRDIGKLSDITKNL